MSVTASVILLVQELSVKYVAIFSILLLPPNVICRLYRYLCSTMESCLKSLFSWQNLDHDAKRRRVEEQVRQWRQAGKKTKMCTARSKGASLMFRAPKYRDTLHGIRLDDLTEILSIDLDRRVVKVEPMVSMSKLTAALVPLGWTLPVVPELGQLTVGGLVIGGGIETSSHKFGFFHRQCVSFEVVVASGKTIFCSKDQNSDLFQGIPYSYGSLGFLTAVELEIIEAKPFVQLDYHPVDTFDAGLSLIETQSRDISNDFVEALLFSRNKWVVMTGKMVDKSKVDSDKVKLTRVGPWYRPWFYKHVETFLENDRSDGKSGKLRDLIPLTDYYHRHDRCSFWLCAQLYPYGNHPLFRFLFGWALPMDLPLMKAVTPRFCLDLVMIQDFLVPAHAVHEVIQMSERLTELYPVWICPCDTRKGEVIFNSDRQRDQLLFDIGIYGLTKVPNFNPRAATRELEALVTKHKGVQGLYADLYMTREEFRATYDHRLNDILRKKYEAEEAFPEIYSKVSIKGRIEGL